VFRARIVSQRKVVLRLQQSGLERHRSLEFADCLGGVQRGQHSAEVLVCVCVVGTLADGLAERHDSLLVFTCLNVNQPQVVVRLRVVGTQADGFLKCRDYLGGVGARDT